MSKVFVPLFAVLVLSACASSPAPRPAAAYDRVAETAGPAPAARQTPPEVVLALPHGWERGPTRDDGGAAAFFLVHPSSHAVLQVRVIPAEGRTPASQTTEIARNMTASGHRIATIDATEAMPYASAEWTGTLGGHAVRGLLAVRRPQGSPDWLIVMNAYWPSEAAQVAEEVQLMALIATTR